MVGIGGAIYDSLGIITSREAITYSVTVGVRIEQNLYTAELVAIAMAIKQLLRHLVGRQITIITSDQGVLLVTNQGNINKARQVLERSTR